MKNILLVEDDPFLIDIYVTKFEKAGFNVEAVQSGDIAIEKIKEQEPDILVLDIVLPVFDGWEILSKIKEKLKIKKMKIVVLSNLGQKREIKKGLELGATKYLIKAHYTPSQVVEEIKEIINNQ